MFNYNSRIQLEFGVKGPVGAYRRILGWWKGWKSCRGALALTYLREKREENVCILNRPPNWEGVFSRGHVEREGRQVQLCSSS